MIILREIQKSAAESTYCFVRLRSDGVELDSLNISVDASGIICVIEILHNIEGDCAMSWDGAIIHCTAWESEEAAQAASNWSRHYTMRTGTWKGGRTDAFRIFTNLRNSIQDTYLRYILGQVMRGTGEHYFDADLYPAPESKPEIRSDPDEATQGPGKPDKTPRGFLFLSFCGVALLIVIGIFTFKQFSRRAPVPEEIQRLLKADLLPILPLLEKDLPAIQKENSSEIISDKNLPAVITFKDTNSFLDQLYPLRKEEQLRHFHSSIMKNKTLPNRQKAAILRHLHQENLMTILSTNGQTMTRFAFDFLQKQEFKKVFAEYLVALTALFPGTPLGREALILFANFVETQQRLAGLLFFTPEISKLCRGTEDYDHFQDQVVCLNYKKYHRWRSMDRQELEEKFHHLQYLVLFEATQDRGDRYRLNDAKFELASLLMVKAKNPQEWQQGFDVLRSINPDRSEFEFKQPYHAMIQSLGKQSDLRKEIEAEAREAKQLSIKAAEVDALRSRLTNRKNTLNKLKELARAGWVPYYQKLIETRIARDKKFSEQNP